MANALPPVAFGPQIAAAAARHHLDPRLLAAVAAQETGGPGARSGANIVGDGGHGRGVFQIDDRYHAFARSPQVMDPAKNADYAAGMLEDGIRRYGDVHKALSAYNAGDPDARGTVTTWGDGAKLGYADSVMRHYDDLGGGGSPSQSIAAESPCEMRSVNSLSGLAFQIPPPRAQQPAQTQNPNFGAILDPGGDDADPLADPIARRD